MKVTFPRVVLFFLLALYASFMVATNKRLTILDDEGTIISTANTPTGARLDRFIHGQGQHLHPPLTDILLHWWLGLTQHSFAWLRVSAILTYIAGLLILARCGQLLGNTRTAWAVLLIGMLWPFGYFYARITGWYCFSFFLISALSYCYYRLLETGASSYWTLFTATAILLVWSNYFGLAVLLLLLADLLLFRRDFAKRHTLALLISACAIALSFAPLIHAFLADTHNSATGPTLSWLAATAKFGYMAFALLASVAVAPWYLPWSIPLALAGMLLLAVMVLQKSSRRFTFYFAALLLGLAMTGLIDLKRLLFITPWLLLAVALSCTTGNGLKAKTAIGSIILAFSIGWFAIATGRHPAISNFYEPWQSVADQSAAQGDVIVSDSYSFLFYLDRALGLDDIPANGSYLGAGAYQQKGRQVYYGAYPSGQTITSFPNVTVVRGAAIPPMVALTDQTVQELTTACRLVDSQRYVRDPTFAYRRKLSPNFADLEYRISVDRFSCPRH